jgi:hypothetical protein
MFLVEFADVWFVSVLAVLWLAAISPLVALMVAYLKGLKFAFYAVSSYRGLLVVAWVLLLQGDVNLSWDQLVSFGMIVIAPCAILAFAGNGLSALVKRRRGTA